MQRVLAIENMCSICGEVNEIVEHIQCPFARAVWFGSFLKFMVESIPLKHGGSIG